MPLEPTLSFQAAIRACWDVVVVGSGPAGGMSALSFARKGQKVLLIERSRFPREKTCGCCLASEGAALLDDAGVDLADAAHPDLVQIRVGNQCVEISMAGSLALSRSELDTAIVRRTIDLGAHFLPDCSATLKQWPDDLWLSHGGDSRPVETALTLACDGVRGTLLDGIPECQWQIAPDAWMGASLTVPAGIVPRGVIAMHVGEQGYVGAVRLADGRSHLAAALEPVACKMAGGPAAMMERILAECGIAASLDGVPVYGTGLLTRQRKQYGARHVLAVGDACAYIEPFTGEGMTWAIKSAQYLAGWLPAQWSDDLPERWTRENRSLLRRPQLVCWAMRYLLHRPAVARAVMQLAGYAPGIPQALLALTSQRPIGVAV